MKIKQLKLKKMIKWIALAILLLVVGCYFLFHKKIEEVIIEDHVLYQYLTGIKVSYKGTIKMNKATSNVVKLSFKEETVELDSTPIYYEDKTQVLFPKTMAVIYPKLGKQYKVNYYATITKDLGDMYVTDRGNRQRLEKCVLYDGNDLYFLVEEATISFAQEKVTLPPLSYVIIDTLNRRVELYNYQKDTFSSFEGVMDEVYLSTDTYKLNLSLDVMYYQNKTRLLLKALDKLPNIEKH